MSKFKTARKKPIWRPDDIKTVGEALLAAVQAEIEAEGLVDFDDISSIEITARSIWANFTDGSHAVLAVLP